MSVCPSTLPFQNSVWIFRYQRQLLSSHSCRFSRFLFLLVSHNQNYFHRLVVLCSRTPNRFPDFFFLWRWGLVWVYFIAGRTFNYSVHFEGVLECTKCCQQRHQTLYSYIQCSLIESYNFLIDVFWTVLFMRKCKIAIPRAYDSMIGNEIRLLWVIGIRQ